MKYLALIKRDKMIYEWPNDLQVLPRIWKFQGVSRVCW